MSGNATPLDAVGDKCSTETSVAGVSHNLATLQTIQTSQNIAQTNIQTIQPVQGIIGTVVTPNVLVGKSVSLDLNPKLSLMKPVVQTGLASSAEPNKITTTLCSVGSTVRIISPGMLSAVERQSQQTQPQLQTQQAGAQHLLASVPAATYHVPRGPAAVANIAAPRSTVATPIVRASAGQSVPASRPGISTTVPNPQWQPKTTSVVYAQPQRHVVTPGSRITTRPATASYSPQQPRLVTPSQGRPVQATMVTGIQGPGSRLIAPVLQTGNNITRIPVAQVRPPVAQISNITTTVQSGKATTQPIQTPRPHTTTGTINRIAVTPVMGPTNRMTNVTSVTVQPAGARQLSINPATGLSTANVSRIVIPSQQVQQQSQPQGAPRVVQTVTSLSNIGTVSRVIATSASASGNVTRVSQPTATPVARITGMALHSMPLAPTRTTPTIAKTINSQTMAQTIQIKPTIQQQSGIRMTTVNSANPNGPNSVSTNANNTNMTMANNSNNNNNNNNSSSNNSNNVNNHGVVNSTQPVQNIYLNSPQTTTTTYYSVESSGAGVYSQYRPTTMQPVRLLAEPTNYEETHTRPNASPRPSILRKRDHDSSPAKGAAKNLVPVLTSLPSVPPPPCSPPDSPRGDRDGGRSSGSTTVSATSSPGLDEEPEQSRITINQTMEMSPRKKPRKQQLTGVELTVTRYNDEEMQFITEEKMKTKEETKDKFERKQMTNVQQYEGRLVVGHSPAVIVRTRPTPSLLNSSWKNRWGSRLHHYRRPSDVRSREERRPTVAELAQQPQVMQKINGWKVYHLTAQMEDLAELEKQVHEKLKTTLVMLESQQIGKNRQDDGLERANELIKGNMQRSSLISEGMNEARTQLVAIFQHKGHVTDILQRSGNKRTQKKREK